MKVMIKILVLMLGQFLVLLLSDIDADANLDPLAIVFTTAVAVIINVANIVFFIFFLIYFYTNQCKKSVHLL